uniref:Uncharacterized protein n=1 Tax=Chaetoceros debilis TaxID=122233 RepID=A0A7S3V589_9STRA|mmetsp:Transcript_25748/g.38051  ORF Transcript_25748/g.38051 Transcript_25748/m.38051 type:complete len:146 (-) Transcript_25748:289-726(-)|eukprot:CAMPEP_0194103266 /NCGR_PEP_ID=MMETSP0150-20130528/3718_1 /TAXON_ID=122233 /ORGANISM="Chaetoceros debilis, Strain MM31A-1" /LENGTH=145 /DNA_ID=CAMNT_0038790447 /DNA_START=59 /DNA_END=496 /DNA_ORIENTATION=-
MDHSRKEEDALNSQRFFSGFRMPMHKNQPLHARPDLPQANRELKYQFARTRSTSDEYGINIFGMTHHDNSLPHNPPQSGAPPDNPNFSDVSATNGNSHHSVGFPSSIVSNSTASTAEESYVEDDIKAAAMILTSSRPPSTIGRYI